MSTSLPTSFGAQLRHYRERAGLTQDALAERAGLTANAVSALERGERQRPYPHTVHALATALQLSADEQAALLAARAAPARPPTARPPTPMPTLHPSPPLPLSLTPLIGRDAEMTALADLLKQDGVRLLSVTGPGGSGKRAWRWSLRGRLRRNLPMA